MMQSIFFSIDGPSIISRGQIQEDLSNMSIFNSELNELKSHKILIKGVLVMRNSFRFFSF